MPNHVVHFEITGTDPARLHAYYRELFGVPGKLVVGQFTDRDIDAIIWFMKSISSNYPKENLGPGSVIGGATTKPATTAPAGKTGGAAAPTTPATPATPAPH